MKRLAPSEKLEQELSEGMITSGDPLEGRAPQGNFGIWYCPAIEAASARRAQALGFCEDGSHPLIWRQAQSSK